MIYKLFSVYDCKIEAYGAPMCMKTKGEAVRGFSEISNDKQSQISHYPEDFTLFELGEFDDSKAKFILHSTPISIGKAIEFVRSKV